MFAPANDACIKRMDKVKEKQKNALDKSTMASLWMVQGNIKKNPPSSYQIGEQVFLRVKDKGGVTRGRKPLSRPLVYLAKIIDEEQCTSGSHHLEARGVVWDRRI